MTQCHAGYPLGIFGQGGARLNFPTEDESHNLQANMVESASITFTYSRSGFHLSHYSMFIHRKNVQNVKNLWVRKILKEYLPDVVGNFIDLVNRWHAHSFLPTTLHRTVSQTENHVWGGNVWTYPTTLYIPRGNLNV